MNQSKQSFAALNALKALKALPTDIEDDNATLKWLDQNYPDHREHSPSASETLCLVYTIISETYPNYRRFSHTELLEVLKQEILMGLEATWMNDVSSMA